MLFLGNSFLGDRRSLSPTQVFIVNITSVKISNGIYDDLYISSSPNYDFSQPEWNFSTILWAQFNENLVAGNINESANDISSVLIKRRRKGTFNWIPLFEIPVENSASLKFERFDRYVANNCEYEYALVFLLADVEGSYNINSITPLFEGLFVTSGDRIFSSLIEAHTPQIQKNHPSSLVSTIDSKYPYIISHSQNNYYSGTASGVFVEIKPDTCKFDFKDAYRYRLELMDFLCDGKAKFLKLTDGRVWMISIVDNPTEAQESNTDKFTTTFNWAEIGDCENITDLYDNNFIDVSIARRK